MDRRQLLVRSSLDAATDSQKSQESILAEVSTAGTSVASMLQTRLAVDNLAKIDVQTPGHASCRIFPLSRGIFGPLEAR
jgi:hypothetical protein